MTSHVMAATIGGFEMDDNKGLQIYDLRPQSLDQAERIAARLAGSALLPGPMQKEPAIFQVIMIASDLGLSIGQALRGLHVIETPQGPRVGPDASLMMGLCLREKSLCRYFRCVEETPEKVTYETLRVGEGETPERASFDLTEAKRAGLWDRGRDPTQNSWQKWTLDMLHARARSRLARRKFPDLMFGLYSREELEDGAIEMVDTPTGGYSAPPAPRNVPPRPAPAPPASKVTPIVIETEATPVEKPAPFDSGDQIVAYWSKRIGEAGTPIELAALVPELKKIAVGQEREVLLHAYQARRAAFASAPMEPSTPEREPGMEG